MNLPSRLVPHLAGFVLLTLVNHAFGAADVIPDSYYAHQRCAQEMMRMNDVFDPPPEHNRAKVEALFNEINQLCQDYDDAKISGDAWLYRINVLVQKKSLLYPCSTCIRIPLSPWTALPKSFTSYSLLLFPSAEWEQRDREKDVEALQAAFSNFEDSLGNRQAAVWFSKDGRSVFPPDSERAKFYCDRFKLSYNDGPFLITSRHRPDEITSRDDLIIIRLNGLTPKGSIRVLNILEQDLRTNAEIRKRSLLYEEIKQRLFNIRDSHPDLPKVQ